MRTFFILSMVVVFSWFAADCCLAGRAFAAVWCTLTAVWGIVCAASQER